MPPRTQGKAAPPLDLLDSIRIAEMLCTRLCHDITGPIGAVSNGVELLKEEGSMQGQAVDLIMSSAAEAVNRLTFFRRAYGRINDEGEASLTEHKNVCDEFFRGSKLKLDWPDLHTDSSGVSISRKMGRVILNLVIISSLSLIRGGTVSVRVSRATDTQEKQITLTAEGQSVKWDKELDVIVAGQLDISALTPKTVQPFITMKLLEEIGANLAYVVEATKLTLTVTQPEPVSVVA